MGAEAGGDWLQVIAAAAGSGATALVVTLFLHYADKPEQVESWIEKDPEYRAERAAKLRGARVGATYRDFLTRGLDWLDRNWGDAGSAKALGICIIIGLCYAYAAFFLAWGVGGPGHIGGTRLPDGSIDGGVELLGEGPQPRRRLVALWLIMTPALGFTFGRWLGRQERGLWVVVFGILFAILLLIEPTLALVAGLLAVGPITGVAAAWRSQRFFFAGVVAAVAGAGAAAVAFAVAFAEGRGSLAFLGIFPVGLTVSVAFVVAFVVAFAGTVTAATAATTGRRSRQGAFAAGIGSLVGLGILVGVADIVGGLANEFAVVLIVFFLVLPVVNGLWDWLSWWITRALGRHLLTTFGEAGGLARRVVAVVGHGALDLVLAVALLAAMAFFLAFGFEIYNRIAIAQRGADLPVFDLGPYLASAAVHPWTDGLWLTVMLISTLAPTALHVVALLASPIALITLPTEKRLRLADELETYDRQPERQASIQRRAGRYLARERHAALALAAGLFIVLMAGLLALINLLLGMLEEGETIAHLVMRVAEWGIAAARMLLG